MGQQILRAILVGLILISVIDLSVKTFGLQSPKALMLYEMKLN